MHPDEQIREGFVDILAPRLEFPQYLDIRALSSFYNDNDTEVGSP